MAPDSEATGRSQMDRTRITRLLELGLSDQGRRPVDELTDRLSRPDGKKWLKTVWKDWRAGRSGTAEDALLGGEASAQELNTIKEAIKTTLKGNSVLEVRLAGLMRYFCVVAAALAHHGEKITGQPADEVAANLMDLAAATPEPWADLLIRAVVAVRRR